MVKDNSGPPASSLIHARVSLIGSFDITHTHMLVIDFTLQSILPPWLSWARLVVGDMKVEHPVYRGMLAKSST